MSAADSIGVVNERRHISIQLTGPVAETVDVYRRQWDPVMTAIAPPHLTLVYPEETVDEAGLDASVRDAATRHGPLTLRLKEFYTEDGGAGGVFVRVDDPLDRLHALRDELLLPPQSWLGHPFHVTIVHPRTSNEGPRCWSQLRGRSIGEELTATELVWSSTNAETRTVLGRIPLDGPAVTTRTLIAAAAVARPGEVLLGHRNVSRKSFPDTWDFVGGHVEPGESPRSALQRELREELGIDATLRGAWQRIVRDDLGFEMMLWIVNDWHGDVMNAAPDEHDDLRWFRRNELNGLRFPDPAYPELLDKIFDSNATSPGWST